MKREPDGSIFQVNPARQARQEFDRAKVANYQTEYDRLNIEPVPRFDTPSEAMFSRRKPQPPARAPMAPRSPQPGPMPPPPVPAPAPAPQGQPGPRAYQPIVSSGRNHEHTWHDGVHGEFEFSQVPDPPATPFTHGEGYPHPQAQAPAPVAAVAAPPAPPPPPAAPSGEQGGLLQVEEGDYCVFLRSKLLFATPLLEEAEDALNRLIFDNAVNAQELVVMKRVPIKLGASINER